GGVEKFLGVPAKTWQTFLMSNEEESWFNSNVKSSFFKVSVS
ncbi:KTSC domain-containing protein, partial [Cronobacter sakazakii]